VSVAASAGEAQPRLRVVGLSKHFGGISALSDFSFEVGRGSIHALLGENGAGKSTLVKIVTGVQPPDRGEIFLDGVAMRFRSPMEARAAGVVAVYQDPKLFPHLDVAENIFMGIHPLTPLGSVARRRMVERAQNLLDTLDARLDPRQPVLGLSIGEVQFIEIARAMAVGEPRLLFLDEPTATLTPMETERLFRLVRRLQERGASIVFISHRLEELRGFVETATILRDGKLVWTRRANEFSEADIVRAMVGRPLDQLYAPRMQAAATRQPRLEVQGLTSPGDFSDVSFEVRPGEVVGMAGLVGAGRSEIALAIVGLRPTTSGDVMVNGRKVGRRSPRRLLRLGVAYVPEDRDGVGLVTAQAVGVNLTVAVLDRLSRWGALLLGKERALAGRLISDLAVKTGALEDPVSSLSGGNRQKVVLGKWLAANPEVLILDEPTHGIDIATKAQVHRIIADLAARGVAILMISSDLPEILGVSDRILVVRAGRIVATFPRAAADAEGVMAAATGARRAA
jgi:rhamnose transport system ATP-binding protein